MLREALRYLLRHKITVFLTSLGIAVSISCILSVRFLSASVQTALDEKLDEFGMKTVTVELFRKDGLPVSFEEDLVREGIVTMISSRTVKVSQTDGEMTAVYYAEPSFFDLTALSLARGRFFTGADLDRKVCVIGSGIAENKKNVVRLGEEIRIENTVYEVIGILAEDSYDLNGVYDEAVFVPFEGRYPEGYVVVLSKEETEKSLADALGEYLDEKEFAIHTNADFQSSMRTVTNLVAGVLEWIARISLFVSAFGLMSVAYITGAARKKEWGIRKSAGAGKRDILVQLLMESGMIAAAGFLEGTILSYGWITVLSSLLGLPLFVDWKELWEIGGMTVFFGILAGIVPAWRAANATVSECLEA